MNEHYRLIRSEQERMNGYRFKRLPKALARFLVRLVKRCCLARQAACLVFSFSLLACSQTINLPGELGASSQTLDYIQDGRAKDAERAQFSGGYYAYQSKLPTHNINPEPELLLNHLAKTSLPQNLDKEIVLKNYDIYFDHNLEQHEQESEGHFCGTIVCEATLQFKDSEIVEKKEIHYIPHSPILGGESVEHKNLEALQNCIDQTNQAIVEKTKKILKTPSPVPGTDG
ncbi:MAG: hypothetical protein ACU843_05485 [Gammaproteobacteria bacterium]